MASSQETMRAYHAAQAAWHAQPGDSTAAFNFAWWSAKLGRFTDAIAAYEQSIALGLSGAEEAMSNIASIYSERLGDATQAQRWLQRALQRNPRYFPAVFNAAHLAEQCGDRAAALAGFEQALALKPNDDYVLARLCEALPNIDDEHPYLAALRTAAARGDPDVLFSLARIEEQLGHFDQAWQAMASANQQDARQMPPWPAAKVRDLNLQALAAVNKINSPVDGGSDRGAMRVLEQQNAIKAKAAPVFIVGMFRTGSTLLEQILSAHPVFTPLGESEFWPRRVAQLGGAMVVPGQIPDADTARVVEQEFWRHIAERGIDGSQRVTDKRPDNLFHLTTILKTLPHARVVITQRDWRDTLLSVYGTRLHWQHSYAIDVTNIRDHIRLCAEIAAICSDKWPSKIYIQSYERLVANPEDELRRLFHWLGESWDPGCLDFHLQQNSVRTASVWQVREPLNNRRLARWRHYERPLRAILGDALDANAP